MVTGEPLGWREMAERLALAPGRRPLLKRLLREMESEGTVARIRKDQYVSPEQADLVVGAIQFQPSGAASVATPHGEITVTAENTWTAMHGDRVVARIEADREGVEWRPGRAGADKRSGRVIRILERANETIVGTLQRSKHFYYVVADDPRFVQNLYVPSPRPPLEAKPGDKVVARLESWETRHVNPEGRLVEVLGSADRPGVDMLAIIRKHHLPECFPDPVVGEAEAIGPEVGKGDIDGREDLRGEMVFTIDPDDARDFDDAIQVRRHRGNWLVGVHIADVAHYVRPRSVLDREARGRGNSVYLPDRVIPMLPESLSNGICSLRPDVDRLAFSVFAEITPNGGVRNTRFAKTVIRSKRRLTYKQALEILRNDEGTENGNAVAPQVRMAWEAASALRKRRFARGSLDLDFPEAKVLLDEEGRAIGIERVENDISHQLVEEFMLMANEAVARELNRSRQPVIYRVHEKPDPERLEEFRETALSFGLKCGDLTNRKELQRLLDSARGAQFEFSIKLGLLKSLKRARYATDPLGHYGLSKSDYLHFTSPIRRYADLVAHRALERRLGLSRSGPASTDLPAVADHVSATERTATDAEREAVKLKKLEYFQNQVSKRRGEVFPARIVDVRNFGMFVELPDLLISGLIHVSALEGDFFVHEPRKARLIGRRSRKSYSLGEEIPVTVARVDLFKQQVDFRPA